MTHVLSLGAINKLTGERVYPKNANKKDEYYCPECNKDLILCQGKIIAHHYRHKIDSINPCHYYSNPTETQIHIEAKILLKKLLERKILISFIRNCCSCKKNDIFEIPEIGETSMIELEYRFEYNGVKIADVAYIENNNIVYIFEICNTHKTYSENRPEPWFEINAETLIKLANENSLTTLQIPCVRCEKCDACIKKEDKQEEQDQIYKKKNTRYLIRELDRENFVYLNVDFSKKDFVKNLGGKWNKIHKLWYISHDKYEKHENYLKMYCIFWKCKDCEDMEKLGEEGSCNECWEEDVGWIREY